MAAEVTDDLSQQTVSDAVAPSQIRKLKRDELESTMTTVRTDIVGDEVHEVGHAQQPAFEG